MNIRDHKSSVVSIVSNTSIDCLPPWINWMHDKRWKKYHVVVACPRVLNVNAAECVLDEIECFRYPIVYSSRRFINLLYKIFVCYHIVKLLCHKRPHVIVCIENDVLPAVWLYMKLCKSKPRLFMHFYEYIAPGDRLSPWTRFAIHFLPTLLKSAEWISQCNNTRLTMFRQDHKLLDDKCHVFHNYPPESWSRYYVQRDVLGSPVKSILIGSIGLHTMFVREFADFVIRCQGALTWDVFAPAASDETAAFFESLDSPYINFHRVFVAHEKLPALFADYDVGLLLYKGCTKNVAWAESNKFYEYLSCGLDVWVPRQLISLREYQDDAHYPKVTVLDFEQLDQVNVEDLCSHGGLAHRQPRFESTRAADEFFQTLEVV